MCTSAGSSTVHADVLSILARYHLGVGPTVEYLWSVGVTRGPHFSRDSDQITNDPSSGPTQIEKSPVCSLLELYALHMCIAFTI